MTKAVFTTKEKSGYDDRPWEFYHFPKTYLNQVQRTVGDFVVYYEPRRTSTADNSRGGRQSYFAMGRVTGLHHDESLAGHYYATIDNYLRFDRPVPFRQDGHYYESGLQRTDGQTNRGAFRRAVRLISDKEYELILAEGFSMSLQATDEVSNIGLAEPLYDYERHLIETTLTRPFRSRAFKNQVREAYDNRCAVTGFRLINGGGRPEIEAAHIKAVDEK